MPDDSSLFRTFGKTFAADSVIFREGDEGSEMYIIQKGRVKVSKNFGGKTHVVSVLEKGEFFGEMAIISMCRRTATVTAVGAVDVLAFDREGLFAMITKNARIALTIIDRLCRRLRDANLKIRHLVSGDNRGFVALYLRDVFEDLPASPSLPLRKTVDEISQTIDAPPEEIAAVLKDLESLKMLSISEDGITLVDRGKLFSLADAAGAEA